MLRKLYIALVKFVGIFNKVTVSLAGILTLVGVFTLIANYHQSLAIYDKTFRTDHYWEGVLNSLSVQVNISSFEEKLGKPTITNDVVKGQYQEQIFVEDKFFVEALTNSSEKVLYYTITTRTSRFQPFLKAAHIKLGGATFSDLPGSPEMTGGWESFHDYYYEELYYDGNPGKYLTYIYAINNSGASEPQSIYGNIPAPNWRDLDDVVKSNCKNPTSFMRQDPVLPYGQDGDKYGTKEISHRKDTVITTAGFISPYPGFFCLVEKSTTLPFFAPDYNQVRLLEH